VIEPLKIIARHVTIDMYNCKTNKFANIELLQTSLHNAIELSGLTIINSNTKILDNNHLAALILLKEGHITIHTYPDLKYVAVDIFICDKDAEPEKAVKALRNFFKPEKTKTTYLKRGDFGTIKDMKPKIKTRVAPLRRIHNTGAKVIRLLARRKRQDNK